MTIKPFLFAMCMLMLSTVLLAGEVNSDRKRQAGDPKATAAQLMALADDKNWEVRQVLARNRKSPVALLEKLARDQHPQVRIGVATNLATTEAAPV